MNKITKILATSCIATVFSTANLYAEQPLGKEIVVEKDYTPEQKKASRQNVLPEVTKLAPQTSSSLKYSNKEVTAKLNDDISVMPAYGFLTQRLTKPNRGYAEFAMGMGMNMQGSAGYKILDANRHSLDIWLHHNSFWNVKNDPGVETPNADYKQKFTNEMLGLNYGYTTANGLNIAADAKYHFARLNYLIGDKIRFANANEFEFGGGLDGSSGDWEYNAGLRFNHFAHSLTQNWDINDKPLNENLFTITGGLSGAMSEVSRVGGDLKFDYYNNEYSSQNVAQYLDGKNNIGKLRLTPYFFSSSNRYRLRIGINLDISMSDGSVFNISPDASYEYRILRGVWLFASTRGGKEINTKAAKFNNLRYINPTTAVATSYCPIDFNAGFRLGAYKGFTAEINGGYKKVNSAPVDMAYSASDIEFKTGKFDVIATPYNQVVTHFGGKVGYKYGNYFDINMQIDALRDVLSNAEEMPLHEKPYSKWGMELKVKSTIRPISKLTIDLDFAYFHKRPQRYNVGGVFVYRENSCWNQFGAKVKYDITNNFGVMLMGYNLLNCKDTCIANYAYQPLTIMGGITYKF